MLERLSTFFRANGVGFRAPRRLFWTALAIRLLYMTLAHTYRIKPLEGNFTYGFEAGRIAQALASGFGYSDPFSNAFIRHTGPTAWLPPAYPLLVAAVFKLFGIYTRLSAWILLAINCVLSAATASAVWELGARTVPPAQALRNARWAGWLWALYPAAMQYAVRWIWEMTLTTALFTWILVLALRMRAEPGLRPLRRWACFGLAWGIIALSNSTLLLFLPVCALWILRGNSPPRAIQAVILSTVVFLAITMPWTIRNHYVFHRFIPLRGNFGAELYMGNGPGANGFLMEYNHPFQSAQQLKLYAQMGEVAYVQMRGAAAKSFIASDPSLFLRNSIKRVYFFWISVPHPADEAPYLEFFRVLNFSFISTAGLLGLALALHRRLPAAGLFALAFLLLPLPYYVVTVHARFRHPLEPLITVLAVFLFQSAQPHSRR